MKKHHHALSALLLLLSGGTQPGVANVARKFGFWVGISLDHNVFVDAGAACDKQH